jgi:prepilin peptidase CpaA
MSQSAAVYALCFVVFLTAVAAFQDLRTGLIPNRVVLAGAIVGLGVSWTSAAVSGGGSGLLSAVGLSLLGLVLVGAVPMLLYRAGGIGGGDVKLLATVGAVLGPYMGLEAELYSFSLTLLYAPARLIWEGKLLTSMRTIGLLVATPLIPRRLRKPQVQPSELTSFRFGPAIFLGTLIVTVLRLSSLT